MWKPKWHITLLLLCTSAGVAQFQTSEGRSELSGTVIGMPANGICTAELSSAERTTNHLSTACEPDGTFRFTDLQRGAYNLVVHVGTDTFSDQLMVMLPNEEVQVVVPKREAPSGGDTVSVAELKLPEKAQEELEKANESLGQGDLEKAEKHSNKALEIAPRSARTMTARAAVMLAKQDYQSALQLLNTSAETEPSYQMTHFERAAALNALGRPRDAQLAAEQGLRFGEAWQGHLEMAKALMGQKMYRQALTELNRAQNNAPQTIPVLYLMRASVLLHLQDFNQAQINLNAFEKLSPNDTRIGALQALLNRDLARQ